MNKIDNIKDCLLIIDVQNDFCAGGALEVPAGDEVVGVINQLGTQFEHKILTQDWHPAGHESFASSHAGNPAARQAFSNATLGGSQVSRGNRWQMIGPSDPWKSPGSS